MQDKDATQLKLAAMANELDQEIKQRNLRVKLASETAKTALFKEIAAARQKD